MLDQHLVDVIDSCLKDCPERAYLIAHFGGQLLNQREARVVDSITQRHYTLRQLLLSIARSGNCQRQADCMMEISQPSADDRDLPKSEIQAVCKSKIPAAGRAETR